MTSPTPRRAAAASRALRRAMRADRIAAVVIALGGVGVIASVAAILVFIAAEAFPLFRGARVRTAASLHVEEPAPSAIASAAFATDDHGSHVYRVGEDGMARFWRTDDGRLVHETPVPGVEPARVTASSHNAAGDQLAVGTSDGRVVVVHVRLQAGAAAAPLAETRVGLETEATIALDEAGRAIHDVSSRDGAGRLTVAGVAADRTVRVWWREESGREQAARLGDGAGERFTTVRVGGPNEVAAGTESGRVYLWSLDERGVGAARVFSIGARPVTALGWLIGDRTLIAGDADGHLSAWFEARVPGEASGASLVGGPRFVPHVSAVTSISPSGLDRSFLSSSTDGSVALHHATSRRSVLVLPPRPGGPRAAVRAPRSGTVLADEGGGRIARVAIDAPHPEVSADTLFGKVSYEGYPQPAFVWQSTGASDEFEPKLSLVPLVFGTLKAASYALLFAVPLAVLGALYTSQFAHPTVRARLKPAVEIMAALPSVVVGLIAGLWLAAFVDRHLVAVLLGMPLALASGTAGVAVWSWGLPPAVRGRTRDGAELLVIVPMVLLGLAAAFAVGPWLERLWFGGDLRAWLNELGFTYDQRNGLVVGLAMGFAVIPVIYTIADDAFASVPRSLMTASAALGATRWQTAWRIVVPTASAGVVSAVMIGFGRAVGETMIVLMVSGNTPLMDWSAFNGLRTLSANLAIEVPEAAAGGTLYRVLFLSAALLFALTFAANTVAELIRQRLRERYKAI